MLGRPQPVPSQRARGLEAVTATFLRQTRRAALGRFTGARVGQTGCRTLERSVFAVRSGQECSGKVVAHISGPLFREWAATAEGSATQQAAHVVEQVQLVLKDLTDHDMHGYLALTDAQCKLYGQDLLQLVAESLQRTTFCGLEQTAVVHWEGTLVRSLGPPTQVLVVSIGV